MYLDPGARECVGKGALHVRNGAKQGLQGNCDLLLIVANLNGQLQADPRHQLVSHVQGPTQQQDSVLNRAASVAAS